MRALVLPFVHPEIGFVPKPELVRVARRGLRTDEYKTGRYSTRDCTGRDKVANIKQLTEARRSRLRTRP